MSGRIPPLNLTESEMVLLRTLLQHHADSNMEDPDLYSMKEKADKAHQAMYRNQQSK